MSDLFKRKDGLTRHELIGQVYSFNKKYWIKLKIWIYFTLSKILSNICDKI
jgi:hypothetical protein